MKIKIFIWGSLLVSIFHLRAQDFLNYNLYIQNPLLYNAAYTYNDLRLSAYFNTNMQWIGFDGAPRINSFGISSKLAKNMGLGLVGYQSKQGLNTQTSLSLAYAFRANFDDNHFLNLGVKMGPYFEGLDYTRVKNNDITDTWFVKEGNKSTTFSANFGVQYHFNNLDFAIAMTDLYQKGKININALSVIAYDIILGDNLIIKPSILYRYSPVSPVNYHVNTTFEWKKTLILQAGFQSDKSVVGVTGVKFGDYLIAYSYKYSINDIARMNKTTHEIQINYLLPFRQRKPRTAPENSLQCPCKSNQQVVVQVNEETKNYIELLVNISNKSDKTPVMADVFIIKDDAVVKQTSANDKGIAKLSVIPDVYKINVKKNGYIPIKDVLNLSTFEIGSSKIQNYELTKLEEGLVFSFAEIQFEIGSDQIKQSSYEALDMLIEIFNENPSLKVEIGGHTDNVGSNETNLQLSENRANAVKKYFISKGVNPVQIVTKGYGASKPIFDNSTEQGRNKNRRVEFIVLEI